MQSRVVKPGFSVGYILWLFTRISAVALLVTALVGMFSVLVMGVLSKLDAPAFLRWAFMPISYHVARYISIDKAGATGTFWHAIQILVVFLAVTHGFNGVRSVAEDYLAASPLKTPLRGLIFAAWLFALFAAIVVILYY